MRGVKIGAVFAVCGFLLSFVSGLFSHSPILNVLLKALIFAITFGILGFIIDIIFSKFLASDTDSDLGGDSSSDARMGTGKTSSTGQLVDITIQDEDLDKSGSDNHFVINDNRQMLNESDFDTNKTESEGSAQAANSFVPLKNLETLHGLSGKEAVHPDSAVSQSGGFESSTSSNDGLDTLPDMNNLNLESNNGSSDDDAEVETDGEFVSSTNIHKHSDEPAEIKDASLMAKAISSILSDEDS